MISWLRKKAEEAVAQINPFDGGKTAQTVRQARQAQPAVTVRQQAPQQQRQPSYGRGITGVFNRARDVVDANTPQDRYKRQLQNRPEVQRTYQDDIRNNLNRVKNNALGVRDTVDKNLTNAVNVARDQIDANTQTDRERRLKAGQAEMYTDQQRAKGVGERSINNNIAQRGVNFTRAAAESVASGPLVLGRGLGNAAAMMSGDYKRAQESEKTNRDVTQQVEGTMWKVLNDPNSSQAQRDHAVKVLNQQAPQGMENLRAKIASENDPRRLLAAAADTALTVGTAGLAGATKQGVNAAYKGAKATQLATGATLKQATNAGVKAGVKNFGINTAKTAASGAGAGFAGAYTVDPNATLKQGLMGAVQGGVGGAVLPTVFMGPGYVKPAVKAGVKAVPKIVNKAGQSIDDVFNGVRQAYDGVPNKQSGFVANPLNKGDDIVVNPKTGETLSQSIKKLEGYGWAKKDIDAYRNQIMGVKDTTSEIQPHKLENNTLFHGTSSDNIQPILNGGFKTGAELPENAFRGGGYGAMQNSLSFSTDAKQASVFGSVSPRGAVLQAELKPNAKVVTVKGVDYAEDLNPRIDELKKKGIDAVYLEGEKEVVVLDKSAVKTTGKYKEFKAIDAKNTDFTDLYNQAKSAPVEKTAKNDYIKKIRQPIEKELKDAQAEMDKYGTGYINDIDLAAKQARAKARLDKAREADWQNSPDKILARKENGEAAFRESTRLNNLTATAKDRFNQSDPWYKAREEIKNNYIDKFKTADEFVNDFNTNDGVIPKEIKNEALSKLKNVTDRNAYVEDLKKFYNEAKALPKSFKKKNGKTNITIDGKMRDFDEFTNLDGVKKTRLKNGQGEQFTVEGWISDGSWDIADGGKGQIEWLKTLQREEKSIGKKQEIARKIYELQKNSPSVDTNTPKVTTKPAPVEKTPTLQDALEGKITKKTPNPTVSAIEEAGRLKFGDAADIKKPVATKVDDGMQEVIDATKESIKRGDLDEARMLAESLPGQQGKNLIKQIDIEQANIEKQILSGVQNDLSESAKFAGGDSPDAVMSTVADKLAKHFNAPKALYKITGFKRTYKTPQGDITVGGKADAALDNLIFVTDMEGFVKNMKVMGAKFGGTFKEISDYIKATSPDDANYDIFKENLYGQLKQRPSYSRRASGAIQDSGDARVQLGAKSQRNQANIVNNQKRTQSIETNPTIQSIEEAGAKIKTAPPKQPRVVPQIDEPFDAPLTKTANQPPTPPKPPAGVDDQKAIGAGIQKKSKFANETVPESDFVSQPIKDATKENAPLYTPKSEREGVTNSVKRLKAEGDEKFGYKVSESLNKKEGTISRQEAIDAQVYAAKLEEAGDKINISKASEVYDKLSAHYTKAGQLIQAAAMMSKRSPAGMKDYANKQFAKAGVKVTPKIQQQIDDAIAKLAKTKPETDANAKAMDGVLHTIAKNIPQSKADLFINTWRANLLTAPTTTLGGFVGGVDAFVNRKLWTNPIATMVDMATSLFTGKRSMTMAGGFSSGAKKGIKTGVSKEYWKTGFEPMDGISGKTKYDAPRDINYGDSKAGKVAGKYVNSVYRTMGLVDKPWKYGAQKEALKSMAKAEGLNKGYKGKQLKQYVDEFIENPPEAALNKANEEGRYAVFQDETALGDAVSFISKEFRKKGWNKSAAVVDFIVPFKQIPGSIATRIIKRTPLGTAQNIVKQITDVKKGGQFDQRAFSQATAEGFSSVPIIAAGYALAQAGQVTGGYPIDEKERKLWQAEGKQPNSVKVGDRWYSLNYIQPFGALLNIGAGASQADKDGKDGMDLVWAGIAEGGKSVSDMSFLQGVSGAIDAIKNPKMAGERYVQNTASSAVPNFVRSFANASDKYERQASGIKEGVQSAIPGWRQQLPAKKDAYGNDVKTKDNFLNRFVNPLKPSIAKNDDVTAELRRLKDNDLGTMPSSSGANALGEGTKLDKKQLTSLNAEVAKSVTEQWKQTMKSDAYLSSSDEDKKKMLNKVKDTYSKSAKYSWAQANGFNDYADKSLPKGLDKRAMEIISTYNEAKANDPSDNQYVKDTLKNWNNGEEVPVTNEIAKAWADYEKKRLEGKISNLEMNKEKKKVLRKAYSSVLNEDEKGYWDVPDTDILAGLEQGLVTQESLQKALDVDALLVSKGLLSKSGFGKTVWNAFGLGVPKAARAASSGKKGGTARRGGSRGGSKGGRTAKGGKPASKYNYNLFMFGDAPTKSKSLRDLVNKASAKA